MIFNWLSFYTPLALYCLGIAATITMLLQSRRASGSINLLGVMLLTIYGLALFNLALNRSDTIHLLPTSIAALMLVTVLAHVTVRPRWNRFSVSRRRRLLFRLSPLLLFIVMASTYRSLLTGIHVLGSAVAQDSLALHPVTATAESTPPGQAQAVQFIQDRAADSETIFVGNVRNDRTAINDAMFYFLAQRRNATRFDDLAFTAMEPLSLQKELVRDLEAKATRYVVLFTESYATLREWDRNGWGASSDVTLLDEFIRERFIHEAEFGQYSVWVKR